MEASFTHCLAAAGLTLAVFIGATLAACAIVVACRLARAQARAQPPVRASGADIDVSASDLLEKAKRAGGSWALCAVLPAEGADASKVALLLQNTVRQGDSVGLAQDGTCLVAMAEDRVAASVVSDRLRTVGGGHRVGLSAFPYDGENFSTLRAKAVQSARGDMVSSPCVASPSGALPGGWKDVVMPQEFDQALGRYWTAHQEDPRGVSVVRVDIDHYKLYGEQYGPRAGADLVQQLGSVLRRNVRLTDLVAHARDDEFFVLMPAQPDQARCAALRLLGVIRRANFPFSGHDLKLTVSMGIASYPAHAFSPGDLVELSETAMRTAKARGRNTVVVYEQGLVAAGDGEQRDTL